MALGGGRRSRPARSAVAALLLTAVAVGGGAARAPQALAQDPPLRATAASSADRLDQVYFTLQHNTYDYGSTLTGWLDSGLRSVELDVIDKTDWENDPDGPYVSHGSDAGDKNCSGDPDRLGDCLRDLAGWQAAHPGSGPLLVFVDLKASWDPANAWNADEVQQLDAQVRQILGSRMFTGGDLYRAATGSSWTGAGPGLRQAVASAGWPTLGALDGRIVVAYTGGKIGLTNQTQGGGIDRILAEQPARLPHGFFCPDVETDPGELEPGSAVDGMSGAASQATVCSNLKSQDNYQVTANRAALRKQLIHLWGDHVFGSDSRTFNQIAVAHGISAIGRAATPLDTFGGTVPSVGERRSLPGYVQLRPDVAPSQCLTVDGGGTANGTAVVLRSCSASTAQRFVWTAEGQLRPQHDNPGCVDISGGSPGAGKKVHLWDCDGGSSEKWLIDPDGTLRSFAGTSWCLTVPGSGATGSAATTASCAGAAGQRFTLTPVPDWPQTSF